LRIVLEREDIHKNAGVGSQHCTCENSSKNCAVLRRLSRPCGRNTCLAGKKRKEKGLVGKKVKTLKCRIRRGWEATDRPVKRKDPSEYSKRRDPVCCYPQSKG